MKVQIFDNKEAIFASCVEILKETLREHPSPVIGLPTGNTFIPFYHQLKSLHKALFSSMTSFNLDEYCGLDRDHPASFYAYMKRLFFDKSGLREDQIYFPPTDRAVDPEIYDTWIDQKGGLDLVFMGLGQNGHIAFNEPGTAWTSKTHRVRLDEQTRRDNQAAFESLEAVPKEAVTMGLTTLMQARKVCLVAIGEAKAQAVKKLIEEPPHENLPASILKQHACVTIYLDQSAATALEEPYGGQIS
jgi:glucosamine-6-phosphate deaminase